MRDRVSGSDRPSSLRGRERQCLRLDELLDDVRHGISRALVVWGEEGIGKTALLQYLIDSATDVDIVRAAGAESEMDLAYAGVQHLCAPMLAELERLPVPQRVALETVFGLVSGGAPNPLLVGLGVLALFSQAAKERPLLCVIDDTQWLDPPSALTMAFVARRVGPDPVGLVFASREPTPGFEHLALMEVDGLRDSDARALLASAVGFRLDQRIRDRVVAESRGNPSALLELPRGLTGTQLAGGLGLLGTPSAPRRIEPYLLQRLSSLSGEARRLLLLAAAEPSGDLPLLLHASEQSGLDISEVDAETRGLLTLGEKVTFRHSFVRSAIYWSAASRERRAAHLALAQVTDRAVDPDWRAWHLACAAVGPDEAVASDLQRSAGRARERGGLAAAAALLERSVLLTPEPARRTERALAAGSASLQAGAFDAARQLLSMAESGSLDPLQRARVDLLGAQLAFAANRTGGARTLLLNAGEKLVSLDRRLARDAYLEALSATIFARRLDGGPAVAEVARAARCVAASPEPREAADLLLDGFVQSFTDGYVAGAPILQRAVNAFCSANIGHDEVLRWTFLASYAAQALWDEPSYQALAERQIELARDAGALAVLPMGLTARVGAQVHAGNLDAAASTLEDLGRVADATATQPPPYAAFALMCARGREADARQFPLVDLTATVLYNGLGRYGDTVASAKPALHEQADVESSQWLPELVEAAARTGEDELASEALLRLVGMTRIAGTEWALGIETRSRALLSRGAVAEDLYRQSISHLGNTAARVELARAHLLYGEWLRRSGRRADARTHLRTAYGEFTASGWEAFAGRTRAELQATGEKVRKRSVETRDDLTAQEWQIAKLAREGLSNPEIGGRLFLSPRTVEWHLRKVFSKLDINSRRELSRALPRGDSELVGV